jgi:hypothetical protein
MNKMIDQMVDSYEASYQKQWDSLSEKHRAGILSKTPRFLVKKKARGAKVK